MILKQIAAAALAVTGFGALDAPTPKTWTLTFWIDGEVEGVTDADVFTHPCGAVVDLAVDSIPFGRPNIDTDRVVEFDAAGAIVREWRTPVDIPAVVVDGERLIVSPWTEGEAVFLAILPSGRIEDFAITPPSPADGTEMRCPAAVAEHFEESGYLRCERWADRSSAIPRLIAFEEPCT